MRQAFYLTTTLPYVNADPHVGFALEIVQADVLARYHGLLGEDIFFNTGTDEHGSKIYQKALLAGKDPQAYADEYAEKFGMLKEKLNLYGGLHFIRTTDSHHKASAQEFWRRCKASGDIEKKLYKTKYCVGCELEKTDSELVSGVCPLHPNLTIEVHEEENYFFKFSKYQEKLLALYKERPDFVFPNSRFNEIKTFVEGGLSDFSISRLKEKMPWGVPVPDDPDHVMYVWFDALVNYISTLGWPEDTKALDRFWGTKEHPNGIQIAGKDQIRQQSAMWQAMLMSAGLPPSKQIFIHGFITSGGQKMSKSLGNVVDPIAIVDEYGTDALRYFLLRHIHPFEDSDFTMERFKEAYSADLVNGLGNLVARIMQLSQTYITEPIKKPNIDGEFAEPYVGYLKEYDFNRYVEFLWEEMKSLDKIFTEKEPFRVVKTDIDRGQEIIRDAVQGLYLIAHHLYPLMPTASEIIKNAILENKKPTNLFPRKE